MWRGLRALTIVDLAEDGFNAARPWSDNPCLMTHAVMYAVETLFYSNVRLEPKRTDSLSSRARTDGGDAPFESYEGHPDRRAGRFRCSEMAEIPRSQGEGKSLLTSRANTPQGLKRTDDARTWLAMTTAISRDLARRTSSADLSEGQRLGLQPR